MSLILINVPVHHAQIQCSDYFPRAPPIPGGRRGLTPIHTKNDLKSVYTESKQAHPSSSAPI